MDEALRQLLDQVPERAPRSKLEPHREVIRELRKKRRTYAEIAAFLREHLQLSVAPSTIHDFVKTRARQARQAAAERVELPPAVSSLSTSPPEKKLGPAISSPSLTAEAGRERMRVLRAQPPTANPKPSRFAFDPTEPLILNPPAKET